MSNILPAQGCVKTSHPKTSRRTPSEWADIMGRQGYKIRFFGEGEAVVLKPDGETKYFVSLTGETWEHGCTCIAGRTLGRCKHLAVVANFRPCDDPGCTGTMQYRQAQTKYGPAHRWECAKCGKPTDPRRVQEIRDEKRRNRKRQAVA